jgi:hypothetical protein
MTNFTNRDLAEVTGALRGFAAILLMRDGPEVILAGKAGYP